MANKCFIPIGSDGEKDPSELIDNVVDELYKIYMDDAYFKDGIMRQRELKKAFLDAVLKLRDKYSYTERGTIANVLRDVLKDESMQDIAAVFPKVDIRSILKNGVGSAQEILDVSTDRIMDEGYEETKLASQRFFIDDAYGNAFHAKERTERRLNKTVLDCFIIDREGQRIVADIHEAERNVERAKKSFFKDIQQFFIHDVQNRDEDAEAFINLDIDNTSMSDLLFYLPMIDKKLAPGIYTGTDLQKFYDQAYNQADEAVKAKGKRALQAFGSYLALRKFDDFLNLTLGETIVVKPGTKNKDAEDKYKYADKGTNMNTTWRKDENINLEAEVNKLVQALINTSPFYTEGSTNSSADTFLKFSDFVYVTSKIKDLVYNKKAATLIYDRNTLSSDKYMDITSDEKALIQNKSLRSVIASIRNDPQTMLPIVYKLIRKASDIWNEFSPADRNLIWSVNQNFFSKENEGSLYSIQSRASSNNPFSKNFYAAVTSVADCISSVDFVQTVIENGVVKLRPLREQGVDAVRRDIEANIALQSSQMLNQGLEFIDRFSIKPTKSKNGPFEYTSGIEFSISPTVKVRVSESGRQVEINDQKQQGGNLWNTRDLNVFLDNALGLELSESRDGGLKDALVQLYRDNTEQLVKDLVTMASKVMYNKYLNNVDLKGKSKSLVDSTLTMIFPDVKDRPKFNTSTFEINIVPESSIPTLRRLAQATAISYGLNSKIQVRDSQNKMLSTQSLSRLLGNHVSQIINQIQDNPFAAASNFALVKTPGLFKGIKKAQEIKGRFSVKTQQELTPAEQALHSFLYTFIGGMCEKPAAHYEIGDGVVGFIPSVNSDKNTVGTALFDLKEELMPGVPAINMSRQQIVQTMCTELGGYFRKQHDNILADYKTLNEYLSSKGIDVVVDPQENFADLNSYARSQGKKASDLLYQWTLDYNLSHRSNPLALIDQVHFITNGDEVCFNQCIKANLERFDGQNKLIKTNQFIDRQNLELLKDALNSNFSLHVYGDKSYDSQPEKVYLRQDHAEHNYKAAEWIDDSGRLILAKFVTPSGILNVTSSVDFLKLEKAFGLSDLSNNMTKLLGRQFSMNPLLEKYNSLGYLLTQQVMLTAVGSEIAHPGKSKNAVPVRLMENIDPVELETDALNGRSRMFIHNPETDGSSIEDLRAHYKKEKDKASKANQILYVTKDILEAMPEIAEDANFNRSRAEIDSILEENDYANSATRYSAQHKRNVSYTAAMTQFQLGQLDGIPSKYNIAIIDDIKQLIYAAGGDVDTMKPFDGATFVNPFVQYLENNSLNEARAGIDKKQFIHYYDDRTGTGGIIKTAGFVPTNNRQRNSLFYRNMMERMTDIKWSVEDVDITRDFDGNDINYGTFYFKDGQQYYAAQIEKAPDKPDVYYRKIAEVDKDGGEPELRYETNEDGSRREFYIDSNYYLWNMFGGMHSQELDSTGTLVPSEHSMELVVKAMTHVGVRNPGVEAGTVGKDASKVNMFMKTDNIHYMPTIGAVKQGPANINPSSKYFVTHEQRQQMSTMDRNQRRAFNALNFMQIRMENAGIQLDKEHHADGGEVSTPTQVISSATSMGYTPKFASNVYKALHSLTAHGVREFSDSFKKILQFNPESQDAVAAGKEFEEVITKTIVKSLLESQGQQGNMLEAIARSVIARAARGEDIKLGSVQVPYSDASVFPKLVSTISSMLTKAGIKSHMDGILSVLCPTQQIVKMYKDGEHYYTLENWENKYGDYFDAIQSRQAVQDEQFSFITAEHTTPEQRLRLLSDNIEIGTKYLVKTNTGQKLVFNIMLPGKMKPVKGFTLDGTREVQIGYQDLKELVSDDAKFNDFVREQSGHSTGLEAPLRIESMSEYIVDGRELGAYNVHFSDINGNRYQLWDLDIMQDVYNMDGNISNLLGLVQKYSDIESYKNAMLRTVNQYKSASTSQTMINLINSLNNLTPTSGLEGFINTVKASINPGSDTNYGGHIVKLTRNFLRLVQQNTLMALSLHENSSMKTVKINGQDVEIDPRSIQTKAYEIIMPKVFATQFGLKEFDDLTEIRNNRDFFIERILDNYATKVEDRFYDVELKATNGDHVYIKRLDGFEDPDIHGLRELPIIKQTDELGRVWRMDAGSSGKKMYQLFSEHDKVVVDDLGREIILTTDRTEESTTERNGQKVPVTKTRSSLKFYIDRQRYNTIHVSEEIQKGRRESKNEPLQFDDILDIIYSSKNKAAKDFIGMFVDSEVLNERDRVEASFISDGYELNHRLNDVDAIREDISNGTPENIESPEVQQLVRQARDMHTSFLKSLDIIAARIPAQSQQSFMPMKVAGFENPNINTAYVSAHQFYLQGSDLDIDAVTLFSYSFSKNGTFEGWSKYFNMSSEEHMKASLRLPFPTGDKARVDTKAEAFETLGVVRRFIEANRADSKSAESLRAFADIIDYVNDHAVNPTTEAGRRLLELVDDHNSSLDDASDTTKASMIKNFVVNSIYNVINDPANLLEAQAGIDATKEPIAALADKSPMNTRQKTAVAGNEFNKGGSIAEGAVGKQDVGICATGLKSFFACTEFLNSTLNGASEANQGLVKNLVTFKPITIGGKTFTTMANIKTLDPSRITDPQLRSALDSKMLEDDAALIKSVFLSLSVDNAKDLKLAKLNAGPDMMGMYLYGVAMGVDPVVLTKVMTSPLGFAIQSLMKGNELEGVQGTHRVLDALKYIKSGPIDRLMKYDRRMGRSQSDRTIEFGNPCAIFGSFFKELLPENSKKNTDVNNPGLHEQLAKEIAFQATHEVMSVGELLNKLEIARRSMLKNIDEVYEGKIDKTTQDYRNYIAKANQMVDMLQEYVELAKGLRPSYTRYSTIYGEGNIFEDLLTLTTGAEEFKTLGQFLRLNQEIKTNPLDLINYINKFETLIQKRGNFKLEVDQLRGARITKEQREEVKVQKIDFRKFVQSLLTDGDYHKNKIEAYDNLARIMINPLRVLTEVSHYNGYFNSLNLAYEGIYRQSAKFRALKDMPARYCDENGIRDPREKEQVFKNVQNYVDHYIVDTFLSQRADIPVPKSTKNRPSFIYTSGISPEARITDNVRVKLGTTNGNRSFKLFMERVFIPELKAQMQGTNEFVRGLQKSLVLNPTTSEYELVYSLPGTMLPRSDSERALFNTYKVAFNELVTPDVSKGTTGTLKIGNFEYNIADMFIYYNMITHGNRLGKKTLTAIFEDITERNPTLRAYRDHVSNLDATSDIPEPVANIHEQFAPRINPFASSSEIGKYKNPETGEMMLIKKKKKGGSDTESTEFGDEYFEGDLEDYMDNTSEMYDEIFGETYDDVDFESGQRELNLGDYEIASSHLILKPNQSHYTLNPDTRMFTYKYDNSTTIEVSDDYANVKISSSSLPAETIEKVNNGLKGSQLTKLGEDKTPILDTEGLNAKIKTIIECL